MAHFTVTKERMAQGVIPSEITMSDFTHIKEAQSYFIHVCDDLCYPYFNVMENDRDYQIIAQAGGAGCDYRITLAYFYN